MFPLPGSKELNNIYEDYYNCGDELIQWLLPNRVGDMRDIYMNSLGGK
jgi:hypothetical protein